MRFSQRYGYTPVRDAIQLEGMDVQLRNSLWNALEMHFWSLVSTSDMFGVYDLSHPQHQGTQLVVQELWVDFFKFPLDRLSNNWVVVKKRLREHFFKEPWFWVYDFIEFVAQHYYDRGVSENFRVTANGFLEREKSGWRFVEEFIVQITDQTEIGEIESAMSGKEQSVSDHLHAALNLLSDRNDPDYPNSIKESISAVESLVKSTLGTEKGTLGGLLSELDRRTPLHPAYKSALSSLYGYTSDEGGIRHGKSDTDRQVTFEEAKFMLVVCSAFINYVRGTVSAKHLP